MGSGPLYFQRNESVIEDVFGKPHRAEVTPAKLLNDHVPIDEYFADMHRVIAADLVVSETFIFRAIRVFIATQKT